MAFLGAEDFKEQVRRAVDIVDLVGGYAPLRRQGRLYVAHCPWHDDSRPSLQVNQERQSWKCWVCQIGGDVFNFVMRKEGIGFREALVMLAEKAGLPLPQATGPAARPGSPDDKQTLFAALRWAEQQFHDCLRFAPEAEPARRYLRDRGLDAASIDRYRLGFAPDQWQWLLDRARGTPYSPEVLETVGLIGRSSSGNRPYDRFKGRVIFSIRDTQSRCIAFGGRILPGNTDERAAKYINSPETRLFSKSENLYGLDVARDAIARSRQALVMEGYTDVVVARQCGVENAVAVLGTALGPKHVKLLRRFADSVTLVLDGDEAGRKRTNEILDLFLEGEVDVRILTLPDELDPCDYLLLRGKEPFERLAKSAPDALDHKIRIETCGIDLVNDLHRANTALDNILRTIAKAPVGEIESAVRQMRLHQVVTKLSHAFRVPEANVRQRLAVLRKSKTTNVSVDPRNASASQVGTIASQGLSQFDKWECDLIEALIVAPEAAPLLLDTIAPAEISALPIREIFKTYQSLSEQGAEISFTNVLGAIEIDSHKAIFIALDDLTHERIGIDNDLRIKQLVIEFSQRREQRSLRERMASIRSGDNRIGTEIALELLQEQQRQRWSEIEAFYADTIRELRIPSSCTTLAIQCCRRSGMPRKAVTERVRAVKNSPNQYVNDPVWGLLAVSLLKEEAAS